MAIIKSILIGCVILHNLIIEDESNCNLEPLFDVVSNVSHLKLLKITTKDSPKLKMWVPITISKITLLNIYGLERVTMQIKIKFTVCSKKLVNTHSLVLSICLLITYQSLTQLIFQGGSNISKNLPT